MKTPIVQVGDLALNESGAFKIGPFGSLLKKTELVKSGIPVAGIENVLPNKFVKGFRRFITERKFEELSDYEIRPNDVLVTTMGTIGRAASAPPDIGRAIFDSHLFRMRVNTTRIFPPYLCYALNSDLVTFQLTRLARGAIMEGLNTTVLRECWIPLPEMPEQERIAVQLEHAGRLVRTRRYSLEVTDTFLPAAFLELFGHPISNSRGWPTEILDDCCERFIDYRGRTPEYSHYGIPHVTASCIKEHEIQWEAAKRVTEETYSAYMTRGFPTQGDVLLTTEAPLGETAVIKTDRRFSIAQRLLLIRSGPKLRPDYLCHLLAHRSFRSQLLRFSTGSTVKGISSESFRAIPIPLPILSLQLQFAALVERVERLRVVQREALRQAEHLFQSLLHHAFGTGTTHAQSKAHHV